MDKSKSTLGLVTGINNDAEIIEYFIERRLSLEFTKIHLMNFSSTDGSKDILQSYMGHP